MTIKCKNMKFSDCELEILRDAIDKAEMREGEKKIRDPKIQEIISIVESFLRSKKLMCYGGTAINNILPEKDQFYNKDIEFPDYDFFSPNALNDAKELANIYYEKGFEQVEAKAGSHHGTYKVFVNFIPVADITQIVAELYHNLKKDSLIRNGIYYVPVNFLRMSMAFLYFPFSSIERRAFLANSFNLFSSVRLYSFTTSGIKLRSEVFKRFHTKSYACFDNFSILFSMRFSLRSL